MNTDDASRKTSDARLAYLLLRAALGLNLLMHGIARLLSGPDKFVASLVQGFHATVLPEPLVIAFATALPWIETTIGLLVLVGLFTRIGLIAGSLLMIVLTFGTALRQDWATTGLQLTYAAVFAALLAFATLDRYSVDAMRTRRRA